MSGLASNNSLKRNAPGRGILSGLPYAFSSLLAFFLHRIFRYRIDIVRQNLSRSFPKWEKWQLLETEKGFYRNLSDNILETLLLTFLSNKALMKRVQFQDAELEIIRKDLVRKGGLVLVSGHLANWEWASPAFHLHSQEPITALYRPLKSKFFDRFLLYVRSRHGAGLYPMQGAYRHILKQTHAGVWALVADQVASVEGAHWLPFLGQTTAVYAGPARIAQKTGFPLYFGQVCRIRRGYYRVSLRRLCDEPQLKNLEELSLLHTLELEKAIYQNPESWLWSHRRWKNQAPVNR